MGDREQPGLTLAALRRQRARRSPNGFGPTAAQTSLFGDAPELPGQAPDPKPRGRLDGAAVAPSSQPAIPRAGLDFDESPAYEPPGGLQFRESVEAFIPAAFLDPTPAPPRRPPTASLPRAVEPQRAPAPPMPPEPWSELEVAAEATPPPAPQRWTVSELVRHVRGVVERGFAQVTVEGEISNWRPAGSGHCYFTLKDAEAQLSAVIFRRQASLLRFRPADGDAVRLHGQLSVYESRGQMQVLVEWMEQVGFGAVLAALQRLKERLRGEGLFDRKRPLPPFPRCIGVVTSLQGAALRDIVKVCRRRHAAVQLLIYPAAVQGPNCAAEIAAGLRWFNAHPDHAEVVLVARGGGSWEDLHGFDDEAVVRAIAGCSLPVITGLGHATDSTLADLAADLCAPTPSAAAELLTAAQHRVEERVEQLERRLRQAGAMQLLRTQRRVARLGAEAVLRRVQEGLYRRAQRVDELGFRLASAKQYRLGGTAARLRAVQGRLQANNPAVQLGGSRRRLDALPARLAAAIGQRTAGEARRLERATHRLEAMSPLRVLERGYALVYGPDGHLLRSVEGTHPGDRITARLAQGVVRAAVLAPAADQG